MGVIQINSRIVLSSLDQLPVIPVTIHVLLLAELVKLLQREVLLPCVFLDLDVEYLRLNDADLSVDGVVDRLDISDNDQGPSELGATGNESAVLREAELLVLKFPVVALVRQLDIYRRCWS